MESTIQNSVFKDLNLPNDPAIKLIDSNVILTIKSNVFIRISKQSTLGYKSQSFDSIINVISMFMALIYCKRSSELAYF